VRIALAAYLVEDPHVLCAREYRLGRGIIHSADDAQFGIFVLERTLLAS
jgi:hypothetical protein